MTLNAARIGSMDTSVYSRFVGSLQTHDGNVSFS